MTTATPPIYLRIGDKRYQIETYADASAMVLAALEKYDGYYRDLPPIDLINSRGEKCGHVSTNGKVWLGASLVWPTGYDHDRTCVPANRRAT